MILEVKNLKKSFGPKTVLDDVSLSIPEGEIIGLLGGNGQGKSTLIKCMEQLLVPNAGTILFNGNPIDAKSHQEIAYLPEQSALDPSWKVRDAIQFYTTFFDGFDASRAEALCKEMQLPLNCEIKSMSKGMQEKLMLILTMSRKARLYILDEPLGGVDPASRDHILDTILSNFEDGASLLISTHLVSDVERILDRVVFLKDGRIVQDRMAEDIREKEGKSVDGYFREVYR